MSEEHKNSEQERDNDGERIVHRLEMEEGDIPRRKRHRKKYRKKVLYRKKSNIRRKIKKRWLNNRKDLMQVVAVLFIVLPLLIIIVIKLDQRFGFIPWEHFNFLFTVDPANQPPASE